MSERGSNPSPVRRGASREAARGEGRVESLTTVLTLPSLRSSFPLLEGEGM